MIVAEVARRNDFVNLWVLLFEELDRFVCCKRQRREQNEAADEATAQRVHSGLPFNVKGWHFHGEAVHSSDHSADVPLLFAPTIAIVTPKFLLD